MPSQQRKIYQNSKLKSFLLVLTLLVVLTLFYKRHNIFDTKTLSGRCQGCNVVIIDIDSLRANALDCTSANSTTPNICSLAKKGTMFTNHISHSVFTFPSLYSTLTGLYPTSHNMWNNFRDELNSDINSLPDILQKANYQTILVYSWGAAIFDFTSDLRFDQVHKVSADLKDQSEVSKIASKAFSKQEPFLLYFYSNNLHFPYLLSDEVAQRTAKPKTPDSISSSIPTTKNEHRQIIIDYITSHITDVFTQEAIDQNQYLFINPDINKQKIFDLFFHYQNNNLKYLKSVWPPAYESYMEFINLNDPKHINYLRENYQTNIKAIDTALSSLVKFLNQPDISKNTIVILKSDHGEEFYEHGYVAHETTDLYQEIIHTPLIIKTPFDQTHSVSSPTQDIDILPTILDLLKVEIPDQTQGESLVPSMEGKLSKSTRPQISQYREGKSFSFRQGDMKLLVNEADLKLFNLAVDPQEQNDLFLSQRQEAADLFNKYHQIIGQLETYQNPDSQFPEWISPEKREKLIKEGYF